MTTSSASEDLQDSDRTVWPKSVAGAGKAIRVMILGLRAVVGAQGGIESHVRDLVIAIRRSPDREIDFEIVERASYVDPGRIIPQELADVRLTGVCCARSTHLEAITHTFLGVLYAAVRRPDVVHIHGIGPAVAAPLARLFGLRVVVTHHGEDYAREKWGFVARSVLRLGEFLAARFSNERIVIAPTLDTKLLARYGRPFRFIPNGVNPVHSSGKRAVLEKWGLTRGRYIVHVGRVVPEKRQTDLIAAFSKVANSDWRLVLVGGSDHDSPFAIQSQSAATADQRVVMTGAIDRSEVADLLDHAGIFVLPSTHEGLPIALLEAMSRGLPVLVSDLPNLIALGLPQDSYVPVLDVETLAKRLQTFVQTATEEPLRIDWSTWLEPYSMASIASQTIDAYRDCSQNRSGKRTPESRVG